jgi:hypothetical protein
MYVFTLGIILLELAHQKPIHILKEEDPCKEVDQLDLHFDFADRLSATMTSVYGPEYHTLVRKCINCDFGVGEYDLGKPALRIAFYKDVVCVLERLEKHMGQFQME